MLSEFGLVIGRISKKRKQISSSTIQNSLTCIQKHIAGHNPRTGRYHLEIKSYGFKADEIYTNMHHMGQHVQLNWLYKFY